MKNKIQKFLLFIGIAILFILFIIIPLQIKLGNFYIQKGNENLRKHLYKSAFLNYEKASALLPNDENLRIQLGKIFLLKNNLLESEKEFRKAKNIDKNNPLTHFYLLKTLLLEKKITEAIKATKEIPPKIQENHDLEIQIARVTASGGKINEALKILEENPKNEANFYKAVFYIAQKDFKKAENLLKNIDQNQNEIKDNILKINDAFKKIKQSENETYKIMVIAQALNEIDEPYLANILFKEVLEKNPSYRDAIIFYGYSNYLINNLSEAKAQLSKAITLDPIYGLSYYFLGKINLKENKIEEARENFKKAINFGFKNKQSYLSLGNIEKQKNNLTYAEESFKKAFELDQKDEETIIKLTEIFILEKKLDEAEKFAKSIQNNKVLGWVYLEKGNIEESFKLFKKAEEKEPYSAFISFKLGKILKKQNKNSEAKEYFQKTIEYDLQGEWSKKAEQEI